MKKFLVILLIAMLVLTGCAGQAETGTEKDEEVALDFPNNTIRIIAPYAAGGGTDLMARVVAEELAKRLGVSVIVENKSGGSGAVGMTALKTSKNDGYTIALTAVGACTLTPNLSDVGYTYEDFLPICKITDIPNGVAVHKDSPYKTWDDLYQYALANPGKANYGTSGAGNPQNLFVTGMLKSIGQEADLMTHIPFEGGAEAVTALVGQQTTFAACILSEIKPYAEDGTFIPLVVSSKERDPLFPDCPSAMELGMDFTNSVWYGFAAPAGTDPAIADFLAENIEEVLKMDSVIEKFENLGNPIIYAPREEFTEQWLYDYNNNAEMLKEMGLIK